MIPAKKRRHGDDRDDEDDDVEEVEDITDDMEEDSLPGQGRQRGGLGRGGDAADSSGGALKMVLKLKSGTGKADKKKKKKTKDRKSDRDGHHCHRHHHRHRHHHPRRGPVPDQQDLQLAPPSIVVTPKVEGVKVLGEGREGDPTRRPAPREPLKKLLAYVLMLLEKKDSNGFFANPVDDTIAPGYSSVIARPMDFSTMRSKVLSSAGYASLEEFRTDLHLICSNAATYNTQETVYYKSAKKLAAYGQKLLAPERIRSLKSSLPFVALIPPHALGFDVNEAAGDDRKLCQASSKASKAKNADKKRQTQDAGGQEGDAEDDDGQGDNKDEEDDGDDDEDDDEDVTRAIEDIREVVKRPPGKFDAIPDDLTPQDVADRAGTAASEAAKKAYRNHRPMGFLRQQPDGTTSLRILTGEPGVIPGTERDRPVLLGSLVGKVRQGTGSLQGFREDRRNLVKAIYPLYYGAFSSHGPTFDSTFANLTKEETDLVNSTYGDTVGMQYADSILSFSRNCDYAMFIVDHLLDILTGNEHRKTSRYIEEQKMLRREDELLESASKDLDTDIEECGSKAASPLQGSIQVDFESLKSLEDVGIDISFLEGLKEQYLAASTPSSSKPIPLDEKVSQDLEGSLKRTADLLEELRTVQSERLSAVLPAHFSNISKPSDKESELAASVRASLVDMVGQVQPHHVAPMKAIRRAIGTPEDLPTKGS